MAVGTVIVSMSYDSTGFTKNPAIRDTEQHDAGNSSISVHDLDSFIRLIWKGRDGCRRSQLHPRVIADHVCDRYEEWVGFVLISFWLPT